MNLNASSLKDLFSVNPSLALNARSQPSSDYSSPFDSQLLPNSQLYSSSQSGLQDVGVQNESTKHYVRYQAMAPLFPSNKVTAQGPPVKSRVFEPCKSKVNEAYDREVMDNVAASIKDLHQEMKDLCKMMTERFGDAASTTKITAILQKLQEDLHSLLPNSERNVREELKSSIASAATEACCLLKEVKDLAEQQERSVERLLENQERMEHHLQSFTEQQSGIIKQLETLAQAQATQTVRKEGQAWPQELGFDSVELNTMWTQRGSRTPFVPQAFNKVGPRESNDSFELASHDELHAINSAGSSSSTISRKARRSSRSSEWGNNAKRKYELFSSGEEHLIPGCFSPQTTLKPCQRVVVSQTSSPQRNVLGIAVAFKENVPPKQCRRTQKYSASSWSCSRKRPFQREACSRNEEKQSAADTFSFTPSTMNYMKMRSPQCVESQMPNVTGLRKCPNVTGRPDVWCSSSRPKQLLCLSNDSSDEC